MSGLGKLLLVLALVGAAVSGLTGYLIVGESKEVEEELKSVVEEKATIKKKLDTTAEKLEDTEKTLAVKDEAVKNLETEKVKLESEIRSEKARLQETQEKLVAAEEEKQKVATELSALNSALQGKKPEEVVAETRALEQKIKDQDAVVAQLKQEVEEIKKQPAQVATTEAPRENMPPGLSGKVSAVNETWNFVVLNIGSRDGAIVGGELLVYRGNTFIGRVKIVQTEAKTSVADILPQFTRSRIMAGDDVIN